MHLPFEIWLDIIKHTNVRTLSSLLCVNKQVYKALVLNRYELIDAIYKNSNNYECLVPKTKETLKTYSYIIDWTTIVCAKADIPHAIIEELNEHIDFVAVASYIIFSEELIRKYYHKIPLSILFSVQCVPYDILCQIATQTTLETHDWDNIWKHQAFPIDFVKRHIQHVNWLMISCNPKALSYDLINEYSDLLIWPEITKHGVAEFIIERYMHKMDIFSWSNACCYSRLSPDFLRKNIGIIDTTFVFHCQELDEELILELIEQEHEFEQENLWYKAASHQRLSRQFIETHKEKLPTHLLIRNPKIKRNDLYQLSI
jgi:hypothetical protein